MELITLYREWTLICFKLEHVPYSKTKIIGLLNKNYVA